MQKINYFCIVKRFKYILRGLFVLFLTLSQSTACANETDSVSISLLTCGPGQEVYSYYGHTAIRIQGKPFYFVDRRGNTSEFNDVVINYGCFSFRQKYFILRFVFGLTDYQVGVSTFDQFIEEYTRENRWVKEQVLRLTVEEKDAIYDAIQTNLLKENRTYRYNYFYDNCTTRARDMLVGHMKGCVNYHFSNRQEKTYRSMVCSFCSHHPWSAFGNNLLLGAGADSPLSATEQQFLPIPLFEDFEQATVTTADGVEQPLVTENIDLIPNLTHSDESNEEAAFVLFSPQVVLGALSILILLLMLVEMKRKKVMWGIDTMVMTLSGMLGLVLFAMIFSQHPTVSCNFQILLLNPLNLVFLYPTIQQMRKHKLHFWYIASTALLGLCAVIGIFGIQHYAEGMLFLACTLLTRQCWVIFHYNKNIKSNQTNE
ncbi:MAG: DUF4105 domain-containing protein [Prevotella sp.]|nr:DUF4105 domain-containing protein [Prevotella sp.]